MTISGHKIIHSGGHHHKKFACILSRKHVNALKEYRAILDSIILTN